MVASGPGSSPGITALGTGLSPGAVGAILGRGLADLALGSHEVSSLGCKDGREPDEPALALHPRTAARRAHATIVARIVPNRIRVLRRPARASRVLIVLPTLANTVRTSRVVPIALSRLLAAEA